jgi:hypothetical protein
MVRGLELRSGGHFTTDFLLGVDRLPEEHRRAYAEYFAEVIRQRGFPLHTASLWNALAFGWSTERNGYLGRSMHVGRLAGDSPVPVGAFVEVEVGPRVAWAEVIHKEGRDAAHVDQLGMASPECSGARVGLLRARKEARVREALVLDFAAFSDLNEADEDDFTRAARRGRLTGDLHLEREVRYPSDAAGLDDLTLYARYVIDQYGTDLFDELLRDDGRGVTVDDRWDLLLASLATVDEIANDAADLRSFGSYHLDSASYREHTRAQGSDDLFGVDAINEVVGAIVVPPEPLRRNQRFGDWRGAVPPAYRCTGSLVREYLGRRTRADTTDLSSDERQLLLGPGYARLVMEANLAIADRIGETGILGTSGVHVRLDDEWEGSGIWRASRFTGDPPPESRFSPLVALGLGFAATSGAAGAEVAAAPETPLEIQRTDRGWRVVLRLIDTHHTDLPLDETALSMLPADVESVLLELNSGDGSPKRRNRPLDRARRLIRQVPYPIDIYPGVYVQCTVGMGGRLVTARLTRLAVAQRIDDQWLFYEFDEALYRREIGLAPLDLKTIRRAKTLIDQINEVFRRRGRTTDDGGRALRADEVVATVFGPDTPPEITLPVVLALQAGEFEYRNPEYVWFPRISRRTSPRERARIDVGQDRPRVERILKPRMVPMGIRRFRPESGRRPSVGKVASYDAARRSHHAGNRLPESLGPLETWVEEFEIGGGVPLTPEEVEQLLLEVRGGIAVSGPETAPPSSPPAG